MWKYTGKGIYSYAYAKTWLQFEQDLHSKDS